MKLLDVREQDEWDEGHVPGSVHVPYHELAMNDHVQRLERAHTWAVACSAGNRSSLAVSILKRQGVEDLIHVADGGVADLEDEGVELTKD